MGHIRVLVGESLTTKDGQTFETESFSLYNLDGAKFRAEREDKQVYLWVVEIETDAQYLLSIDHQLSNETYEYETMLPEGLCWYILPKGLPYKLEFPEETAEEAGLLPLDED
jgi:hypothetical protein